MLPRALIRRATAGDVPAIVDLLHQAYEEYQGRLDPPSGAHRESRASVSDLRNREAALVAEQSGRIVGCVFYTFSEDESGRTCYMHRLAVLPAARHQGLGSQLVLGVEAEAAQAGADQIDLGVRIPLVDNHRFYFALDYRIVAACAHEGYDLPTFYLMRKWRKGDQWPLRTIRVVSYDPGWPQAFAAEAARIGPVFGDNLVALHHVGSTAVAGLAAKPIIDMMPVVQDIRLVDAITGDLIMLGYQPMGEYGLPGRRYFHRTVDGERTHQMHVYGADNPEVVRHLALPAYLRAHPEEAARYAACKQAAAAAAPHDIEAYMDYKDGLVKELEQLALVWYAEQAHPASADLPA